MKRRNELPPFGAYMMVPNWFVDYFVPILSASATTIWLLLYRKTKWKANKLTVKMPIRDIAAALNMSTACVTRAINDLSGNELIIVERGKSGTRRNSYTVLLYSTDDAQLKAKGCREKLCSKEAQKPVSILSTKLA